MTVKELIDELVKMPQDLPVLFQGQGGAFYSVYSKDCYVKLTIGKNEVMVG